MGLIVSLTDPVISLTFHKFHIDVTTAGVDAALVSRCRQYKYGFDYGVRSELNTLVRPLLRTPMNRNLGD